MRRKSGKDVLVRGLADSRGRCKLVASTQKSGSTDEVSRGCPEPPGIALRRIWVSEAGKNWFTCVRALWAENAEQPINAVQLIPFHFGHLSVGFLRFYMPLDAWAFSTMVFGQISCLDQLKEAGVGLPRNDGLGTDVGAGSTSRP